MKEIEFAHIIKAAGGTAYRVGGSIRNELLGIPAKDRDYCITGLEESLFTTLFPQAKQVGASFPVFLLEIDEDSCEVAFARTERKTGVGHQGFEVNFNPNITIEEDLARRDFAMNAIAYDIIEKKYIDPHDGVEDIKDRVIRATSSAFKEDPLRVYRAARFSAQLGFRIHTETFLMMMDSSLQKDMLNLSVERVYEELKKALASKYPHRFFDALKVGECLHVHFKEIHDLIGVEQHPDHHPEGDAYNHTMEVLFEMSKLTDKVERRFAALAHDFGKARTPREEWPKHHGHEEAGILPLHSLSSRLKLPNKWLQAANYGVLNHMRFHRVHEMRHVKIVDMIEGARKTALGVKGLAQLGMADARGRGGLHESHSNYEPFLRWAELISTVKGKKELEGMKAWDDKRKRQAALIKEDMKKEGGGE
jgi:tRNA nucleotidyltransferase (CCA-adding enzyme)